MQSEEWVSASAEGEEAAQQWAAARAAADAAAAARRHVQPAGGVRSRRPERSVPTITDMRQLQRCHYRGMCCAGCGQRFERGERVRAAGCGLVHPRSACVAAAEAGTESD